MAPASVVASRRHRLRDQRHAVPIRRLHTQQMVHEVVLQVVLRVQDSHSMILPRDVEHVEMLVGLHQRIHTCRVDAGSTLLSISPAISSTLPCNRDAWSTLDDAAYCRPSGQPIHCSFHQILSMRLSWHPLLATATW